MSYAAVHAVVFATPASGDLPGKIGIALIKKAAVRALAVQSTDKVELGICRDVINNTMPVAWPRMVLEVLDINGVLATPTDAQIDTAVDTAWTYFMASRQLNGG